MRSTALAAMLVVLANPLAARQQGVIDRGPYRSSVPRVDSLLGYSLGSRHTSYDRQQLVLDQLAAAAPDRARLEPLGVTVEGRHTRLLVISAPANIARLDAIRADLQRLADPRATGPAEAERLAADLPAVVLLSHSIHGDEPAGFEAAMATSWHLLASDDPATRAALEGVIVLINPSQNPDGHERFAGWSNSVAMGSDDPMALEHQAPWDIQGRFNHYRFDLNRDFIALAQPETRALVAAFRRWRPQVVVDLHSTTDRYFIPPWAAPLNLNLGGGERWDARYGRAVADAFDREGWAYFHGEVFDLFYPGYTDLYPSLLGATGMTFESDGGPELRLRKRDGSVTTFREGIAHHVVASLAVVDEAARSRRERLLAYWSFRATGMAEAGRRPLRRVVIDRDAAPDRADALAALLGRHGVEVGRAADAFVLERARSYLDGAAARPRRRRFPAGSWVVDLSQPEARLATALLEPSAALDSGFVADQLARYERNRARGEAATREGYGFYDITAWSLPLTFGVDAWWTDEPAPPMATAENVPAVVAPLARARVAYTIPGDDAGARLALALLAEGVRLRAATDSLLADGEAVPPGSFLALAARNDSTLHERVQRLARAHRVPVRAIMSGWAGLAGAGVAGQHAMEVRQPRILLAAGDGISATTFGAFWHYFEVEAEYPVVPARLSAIARARLDDYNVIILPGGSSARIADELGERGRTRLAAWVREGGLLLAVGDAALLAAHQDLALSSVALVGEAADDTVAASAGGEARSAPVPGPPLRSPGASDAAPEGIPGAIFTARLDRTHWLTLGYAGDTLPVMLDGSGLLRPSKDGDNPVVFVGARTALAGFTWPGNSERLADGSAWAVVEPGGRGHAVLFASDPLFRGFWRGPARLVLNAVLLGTGR